MSQEHPALAVAQKSWRCVQAHDKQGWLDLMAEDVCIEDPIGVAPTNPTGKGLRGKAAVSEFYDTHIAPSTIRVEAHESHAAANESAHLMTLTTTFANGVTSRVRGIFTYRIDDDGKLTNLRGYWSLDRVAFEPPS
ncbi:MAG: nuclear transport factor 2 family protein [Deltaproteobacteria bacterium]|nr:MAG: nuclear transport factor 2 family protein [Deltaproteobacteria bacterium]